MQLGIKLRERVSEKGKMQNIVCAYLYEREGETVAGWERERYMYTSYRFLSAEKNFWNNRKETVADFRMRPQKSRLGH